MEHLAVAAKSTGLTVSRVALHCFLLFCAIAFGYGVLTRVFLPLAFPDESETGLILLGLALGLLAMGAVVCAGIGLRLIAELALRRRGIENLPKDALFDLLIGSQYLTTAFVLMAI
jgi:hypothetical protein